ncbi:MAG TPA: transcriptional regulator [Actinobacteria bacterium]|nr:transcriptional regulator [Actinomycetota bacterium]
MQEKYNDFVQMFKGLADETRLKIIDMLSSGELCACKILKEFDITQPTLSYHMKILTDCGLVNARREGAWMKYTINNENFKKLKEILK